MLLGVPNQKKVFGGMWDDGRNGTVKAIEPARRLKMSGDPHLRYLHMLDANRRRERRDRELRRIAVEVEAGRMTTATADVLIKVAEGIAE